MSSRIGGSGAKGDTGATGATGAAGADGAGRVVTVVSAQFDKTNATLANVPGLSIAVGAGETWIFRAVLQVSGDGVNEFQCAISGTATATSFIAFARAFDTSGAALAGSARLTALNSAFAGGSGDATYLVEIDGTIAVNAGGTITVQFAQTSVDPLPSSVLVGSSFEAQKKS